MQVFKSSDQTISISLSSNTIGSLAEVKNYHPNQNDFAPEPKYFSENYEVVDRNNTKHIVKAGRYHHVPIRFFN
jgi:hypothetical protein